MRRVRTAKARPSQGTGLLTQDTGARSWHAAATGGFAAKDPGSAFPKKIENHAASVALGFFAYSFFKISRTLRVTPAMAAGVTDRLWEVSDLVALWDAEERRSERAA